MCILYKKVNRFNYNLHFLRVMLHYLYNLLLAYKSKIFTMLKNIYNKYFCFKNYKKNL